MLRSFFGFLKEEKVRFETPAEEIWARTMGTELATAYELHFFAEQGCWGSPRTDLLFPDVTGNTMAYTGFKLGLLWKWHPGVMVPLSSMGLMLYCANRAVLVGYVY